MSYRCDLCGSKKHWNLFDIEDGHGSWVYGKQCKVCGYWWSNDKRVTMWLPITARVLMHCRIVGRNCLRLVRRIKGKVLA